tara:strand:- start:4392 stop:4559 length:168 start_codon:yes stop_codon:yes gene_type:complete
MMRPELTVSVISAESIGGLSLLVQGAIELNLFDGAVASVCYQRLKNILERGQGVG